MIVEACDRHWLDAHSALPALHAEKSSTYGNDGDRFANFTAVAAAQSGNVPRERYALERIVEKAARALNMIDAGAAHDVVEYPDIASLALGCEAMRRKAIERHGLLPLDERDRRAA